MGELACEEEGVPLSAYPLQPGVWQGHGKMLHLWGILPANLRALPYTQFSRSVVSNPLQPRGLQRAQLPCHQHREPAQTHTSSVVVKQDFSCHGEKRSDKPTHVKGHW